MLIKGDYAYLMESPLIDYEIQRNCNLTQIGGLLDSKGYGIATQLGSPYTDEISLHILEMQEKGEIQKFYNRWWKGGSTCIRDEKKDSKANALKVENVGGIFVVLVGGVIFAVVVSLIEFIYYARKNKKHIMVNIVLLYSKIQTLPPKLRFKKHLFVWVLKIELKLVLINLFHKIQETIA
jgi:hypothetical protein